MRGTNLTNERSNPGGEQATGVTSAKERTNSESPHRAKGAPRINDAAWHGPIGQAVVRRAPCTEADPVAVLVTALALFGAMVGNGPHVRIGGTQHPARVWPLIVGKTGSGRKGTSWHEARYLVSSFSSYSKTYMESRVASGLSSGEGLIAAFSQDDENAMAPDGLLTVFEAEFARVLSVSRRDGSILPGVLRDLWDGSHASTMTRTAPLRCDSAYLTVVGHITPRELRLKMSEADVAGGTINRLLPIYSERPHLLYDEPERPHIVDLTQSLGDAINEAKLTGRVSRTRAADELWREAYRALNADEPDGLLGSIMARGPVQAMRLALIYALADRSRVIDADHLRAALAVWKYATDTATVLFGDLSGSTDLDRLGEYIASAQGGRTRTEIVTHLFKRNKSSSELDELLAELEDAGDVKAEIEKPTRGRPTTRYHWTGTWRTDLGELLDKGTGHADNPQVNGRGSAA